MLCIIDEFTREALGHPGQAQAQLFPRAGTLGATSCLD